MVTGNWTFTERVEDFLDLCDKLEELRLARSGFDIQANFHWSISQAMAGQISAIDQDDFRSFLTAWRQLVMRDEPTHLRALLALGSHHLKIEVLRELCELVGSGLSRINSNDDHGGLRLAFTAPRPPDLGQHEYSPLCQMKGLRGDTALQAPARPPERDHPGRDAR